MPGGALVQLVAYGNQDVYLTGSPSITYFKSVYRKHTMFAIESVNIVASSNSGFGRRSTFVLTRSGDLASQAFVEITLPRLVANNAGTVAWTRHVGHAILQEVEFSVGGSRIDKHYTEILQILFELTTPVGKEAGFRYLIGDTDDLTTQAASIASRTILVPLQFFWCRNPGLALPLIALQFHESRLDILFRDWTQLIVTGDNSPLTTAPADIQASLWVDYIFLDVEERSNFASESHEYLIDVVGFSGSESINSTTFKSRLNFNHPTKELLWVLRLDENVANQRNRWTDFTPSGASANASQAYNSGHTISSAGLQLNGNDRFTARSADYFEVVNSFQRHTRSMPGNAIYGYSFSLYPELVQPSGTLNFSRIDSANLNLTVVNPSNKTYSLFVFSLHFNVFRIKSGMGGLAFSS